MDEDVKAPLPIPSKLSDRIDWDNVERISRRSPDPRYYPVEAKGPAFPGTTPESEKIREYLPERKVTRSIPEEPPTGLPVHLRRRYRCVDEYAKWGNPASWSDQMLEDCLPDVR
jgi:hypothetical protein